PATTDRGGSAMRQVWVEHTAQSGHWTTVQLDIADHISENRPQRRGGWSNARRKRRRTVMPNSRPLLRKTHVTTERPPFERIALVLQGGGALGAYQGGVYQALAEANLHPDWVAGISIGAINSALIAGNPPEKRVERLREFWETVSNSPV